MRTKTPTNELNIHGRRYSFVANGGTLKQAQSLAKIQQRGHMLTSIVPWKRYDGKVLYAVYIRRKKDFWDWYWTKGPGKKANTR